MSGLTSNLGLTQPAASDIVDVSAISSSFNTIDSFIAFALVTSTSDIEAPFEGLKVLDANGLTYIYVNGSGWVNIGIVTATDGPKGKKGLTTLTADSTPTFGNSETMTNFKNTFVSEMGRRYWIEVSGAMYIAGVTNDVIAADCNLRWAVGSSVSVTDTAIYSSPYRIRRTFMGNKPVNFCFVGELIPNVTGNVTVGLTVRNSYSTGSDLAYVKASSTSPANMLIRDVGASA